MSLIAWYPLNGDDKNYGLGDMELTWTTAPTFVDGKLGKGMRGGSGYWTAEQTASILNNDALSICFWAKPLNTSATAMYFGNNSMTPPNNRKFSLFAYPGADDFHWSWQSDTDTSAGVAGGVIENIIPIGEWSHVCITYGTPNGCIYINGSLVRTFTGTASGTYANQTTVIHNEPNRIVNDYRFYDHCLSPKEVKEISKGLVLHYPMNEIDGISGGRNLFIKNKAEYYSVASSSWNDFTLSAVISGSGGIKIPSSYFIIGQTYALSFKFKKTSGTLHSIGGHNAGFSCSSFNVDSMNTGVNYGSGYGLSNNADTHIVSTVLTYNGNSGDGDNNLYIQINRGYGVEVGFDLWDIKLETGRSATPWTPSPEDIGTNDDSTVYDCSGYGNNGSVPSGKNPVWSSDAKIGQGSYKFSGSQYLVAPRTAMIKDAITVSCWAYMDNWSNFATNDMRLISCTEGGGWNFEPTSANSNGKINFAMGTGTSSNTYMSANSTTLLSSLSSGWHLFTGTYDGLATKIYIDGILEGYNNAYSSKTPIYYNANNAIFIGAEAAGNATSPNNGNYQGLLQDIRIYATALSDTDIKELYNTRLSIANDGTLLCNKYIEEDTVSSQFKSTGIITSNQLNENPILSDMKIMTLDDGSFWCRIFYHNNKNGTVLFSSANNHSEARYCSSEDKYSRLDSIENFKSNIDNKFEFILKYPTQYPAQYNRWKQSANPVTTAETNGSGGVADGYEAIHIDWSTNYWGGLLRSSYGNTFIDGSIHHSNWFYAIGSCEAWGGGIPADSNACTDDVELWVRFDNTTMLLDGDYSSSTKTQIYNNSIITKQLIEY